MASSQSIKARESSEERAAHIAAVVDVSADAAHTRAVQHILDIALPVGHKCCL